MTSDLHNEATSFFDEFVRVFSEFDGDRIAARYATPYLAIRADGSTELFVEHSEIGRYFQRVVDSYHEQGCRSCRYDHLEVVPLGERCFLATVTWELLDGAGDVLNTWRESYNVVRTPDGLRIFTSVDHEVPSSS